MPFIEIILLAIGLSMDSMAVSLTGGAVIKECRVCHIFKIASFMGLFQAGMTIVGYFVGLTFARYITEYDHWVAFILLFYLGGKMIYDSMREKKRKTKQIHLIIKYLPV